MFNTSMRTKLRGLAVGLITLASTSLSLGAYATGTEFAGCMEETAGFAVQCTANDVRIAGVASNPDGTPKLQILDDGCAYQGDTVEFTATFDIETTSKERHDVGIYFVTDGDPNKDGAVSGQCSISTLPFQPSPPWLDLDGIDDPLPGTNTPSGVQDECGDISKPDFNPLSPTFTLTATCVDPDNDGQLNIPYCTSWRQSGANELCVNPSDAFPGSPSKCKCDDTFNIPIAVPPAELLVSKSVNPTTLVEPGGNATFTVTVTNVGIDPNNNVTLNTLSDSIYGDITTSGHDGILSTTCSVPQVIPADDRNVGGVDTYTCQFTTNILGNAGDVETDIVTASGIDDNGNSLSGEDTAQVTLIDSLPSISLDKTANPTSMLEPGGLVTFSVVINNTSPASSDPVTITSLVDNIHGNLNGQGDCVIPQLINVGASYSCSFQVNVVGNAGDSETDTITALGADDEGNPVSASDSATVAILNAPSSIEVIKTASPLVIDEPGGSVTYTYTINNTSSVDAVTIDVADDDKLGSINGQGSCQLPQVITPSGSYTCTITTYVAGNGNTSVTNVVSVSGLDDDGEVVSGFDDATVNIQNTPPAATLVKTATQVIATYQVSVSNDSDAESLTITQLADDMFGDITVVAGNIQSTTCSVPQVIQPATQAGDSYSCEFTAIVTSSPHVNNVTATVVDDDGSQAIMPSDTATVSFD
ncbi:hypothetical protein HG263_06580 [Pseudoalteromonas sp. JBTF-M23]|uniref:DUF7507 domain-containing protein n=1 Tax=Pseudoalteromonas caenipelagi TaxID=2726988 RepID=A0A849VEP9_9GAMM|nr:hypothetical protein [Pseudoalteromonas caenipelagi]NOU50207.1 hypothetical protein [Pseudoalteromonas caenipelagi]